MAAPIKLKYFNLGNLGGRGGVVRFCLLANNIAFTEIQIDFPTWGGSEKARILSSGENPAGYMPLVYDGNKVLQEHHTITRYYARQAGVYGKDAWVDYVQDAVAESMKEWRKAWADAVQGNDEAKKAYGEGAAKRYEVLEGIIKKFGGLGPNFSVGDAVIFGQVHDDRSTGTNLDLTVYPNINATIAKGLKSQGVKKWCNDHGQKY
jgi:glutathione S-transferase